MWGLVGPPQPRVLPLLVALPQPLPQHQVGTGRVGRWLAGQVSAVGGWGVHGSSARDGWAAGIIGIFDSISEGPGNGH